MDRYIVLPAEGVYCPAPKPSHLTINEVPARVTAADLEDLLRSLAEGRGLQLGGGEGPTTRPQYSRNYRYLLRTAMDRKLPLPNSMKVDAEREAKARETAKPARDGVYDFA